MHNDFIQELIETRKRYGISQSRLAVACGISREYYNRIENGRTQLTEALKALHMDDSAGQDDTEK